MILREIWLSLSHARLESGDDKHVKGSVSEGKEASCTLDPLKKGEGAAMKELTDKQTKRQDLVDNAIYHLIREVNPTGKMIAWDIEMIGDVRDVIRRWLVEKMDIASEQTFYPYLRE